jgi:hypothetical protein
VRGGRRGGGGTKEGVGREESKLKLMKPE